MCAELAWLIGRDAQWARWHLFFFPSLLNSPFLGSHPGPAWIPRWTACAFQNPHRDTIKHERKQQSTLQLLVSLRPPSCCSRLLSFLPTFPTHPLKSTTTSATHHTQEIICPSLHNIRHWVFDLVSSSSLAPCNPRFNTTMFFLAITPSSRTHNLFLHILPQLIHLYSAL